MVDLYEAWSVELKCSMFGFTIAIIRFPRFKFDKEETNNVRLLYKSYDSQVYLAIPTRPTFGSLTPRSAVAR